MFKLLIGVYTIPNNAIYTLPPNGGRFKDWVDENVLEEYMISGEDIFI